MKSCTHLIFYVYRQAAPHPFGGPQLVSLGEKKTISNDFQLGAEIKPFLSVARFCDSGVSLWHPQDNIDSLSSTLAGAPGRYQRIGLVKKGLGLAVKLVAPNSSDALNLLEYNRCPFDWIRNRWVTLV